MLGHSRQIAGERDVRDLAHGRKTQGRRAAERHRLHPSALRPALGSWPEPGRGKRPSLAQPPALRQILRARRGRLQPGLMRRSGATQADTSYFSEPAREFAEKLSYQISLKR